MRLGYSNFGSKITISCLGDIGIQFKKLRKAEIFRLRVLDKLQITLPFQKNNLG